MELATKSNNKFCLHSSSSSVTKKKPKKIVSSRNKNQKTQNSNNKSSSFFLQTLFSATAFTSFFSNETSSLSTFTLDEEKEEVEEAETMLKEEKISPITSIPTTIQKLKHKENHRHPYEKKSILTTTTTSIQNLQESKEILLSFYQKSDIQGMTHWLRHIFRHWEMIGNSFLEPNQKIVNGSDLVDFYNMLFMDQHSAYNPHDHDDNNNIKNIGNSKNYQKDHIHENEQIENENRQQKLDSKGSNVSISLPHIITESYELLLDQMHININGITKNDKITIKEWSRSLICLIHWIYLCHQYSKLPSSSPSSSSISSPTPSLSSSTTSSSSSIIFDSLAQNKKNNNSNDHFMNDKSIPTITHLWPSILTQKFIQVMSKLLGTSLQSTLIKHISR